MPLATLGLGSMLLLLGSLAWVVIVVEAFRDGRARGFASLCVPPYAVYFGVRRLEHPLKLAIVGLWLFCAPAGYFLVKRVPAGTFPNPITAAPPAAAPMVPDQDSAERQ